MKINKLTVSRDFAEPSTESMIPKLTLLFILTFLFLFSGSVYGNDLQWEAEDTGIVGAVAYVNGGITYGDKNRIVFGDSKCNVGEQLFSFYTRANNKDIQT